MNFNKILIGLTLSLTLFAPIVTFAQNTSAQCDELKKMLEVGGGGDLVSQLPKYCTQESVFDKVISSLFFALGPLAAILYIYGGYLYMSSGASESNKKKGKEVLIYTTVGTVLAILSGVIIRAVVNLIVSGKVF